MATTITVTTDEATAPVTVLPMTRKAARAVAPVKVTKATKRLSAAMKAADAPAKATKPTKPAKDTKPAPATEAPKAKPAKAGTTFTTVDLAKEQGVNAKTLRARIRRNIEKWEPLFAGERHTFADNATTRKAIAALLATAS